MMDYQDKPAPPMTAEEKRFYNRLSGGSGTFARMNHEQRKRAMREDDIGCYILASGLALTVAIVGFMMWYHG